MSEAVSRRSWKRFRSSALLRRFLPLLLLPGVCRGRAEGAGWLSLLRGGEGEQGEGGGGGGGGRYEGGLRQ